MSCVSISDTVQVSSIRRRGAPPPAGVVEALDCDGIPGVLVRFPDLVNGVDYCYAAYDELVAVKKAEQGDTR